ncbi:winged helix-turn-helix transcriptional regulator [Pyramidobacter sp. SM-530-WT-4B]|uniref:Winged helix-turn-helix transcriptional regulator n=1 Tax=Pyramidobacter porci TaxID=2605789 RepID=A0A6L5YCX7_9BACT|nr:metalloregulator ArsR/SmtB family transcription factor [Pyramidobacter porci]MCI6260348.1 metalloregulator ArsR/SmtB family transcription factor [Pyramidobacter sp.]MST56039.1 winged helix-turn-helix transcriptional regulator [Pyramidobacter porci]
MDQRDLQGCVAVFKAVAHPARLLILEALAQGELCACKIAELFPELDRTTVSKHLALMVEKNVLRVEKRGVNSYYSLGLTCLPGALECVRRALNGTPRGSADAPEQKCRCGCGGHKEDKK